MMIVSPSTTRVTTASSTGPEGPRSPPPAPGSWLGGPTVRPGEAATAGSGWAWMVDAPGEVELGGVDPAQPATTTSSRSATVAPAARDRLPIKADVALLRRMAVRRTARGRRGSPQAGRPLAVRSAPSSLRPADEPCGDEQLAPLVREPSHSRPIGGAATAPRQSRASHADGRSSPAGATARRARHRVPSTMAMTVPGARPEPQRSASTAARSMASPAVWRAKKASKPATSRGSGMTGGPMLPAIRSSRNSGSDWLASARSR